jgi:hypothetical protein
MWGRDGAGGRPGQARDLAIEGRAELTAREPVSAEEAVSRVEVRDRQPPSVTNTLWSLTEMVRVIEEWKERHAPKLANRLVG